MMSKFELAGIGLSIMTMALALYLVRVETSFLGAATPGAQLATVANTSGVVVVEPGDDITNKRTEAFVAAADERGNLNKMVIDDIKIGDGAEVKEGDTVEVHYVGRLQSGQEFDSSRKRGDTFEFTVGEGRVIAGWEQGLIGMKVGGERILVIPPELAYGNNPIGPIPANSTLIFMIELISIK